MTSKEARSLQIPQMSARIWQEISKIPQDRYAGDWFNQAAKAALSVGSNWCEAVGRSGVTKNGTQSLSTLNFYRIARGSGYELSFQISAAGLSRILKDVDKMCDVIDREIDKFIESILLDTGST